MAFVSLQVLFFSERLSTTHIHSAFGWRLDSLPMDLLDNAFNTST